MAPAERIFFSAERIYILMIKENKLLWNFQKEVENMFSMRMFGK